ncbi:hypothetical protein QZH41_007242 [Actinostola sp. cb2023]|nr:hypothetical protein QZH41_007242 [Actinostola sp. cb2023]
MASPSLKGAFRFAIDRGGTFTDVYAECPNGKVRVMKLLSEDPDNYEDAPREGIRRILQEETGIKFPADKAIDPSYIEWIRMGTTVATNALLERKGEKMALAVTKGYRDLLHIGNQTRPKIFDLKVLCPEVLYEEIIEVNERVVPVQEDSMMAQNNNIVNGASGEKNILKKGIKSLAVVLMHSYIYDVHEREVGEIARELGFEQVSLSSVVMPMMRIVPRGYTACADAYLTPCIKRYVSGFASGFKDGLKVGYAMTTYGRETSKPVIGFDMGGTSTDVSRYAGHYEHVFETTTAGVTIQAPQSRLIRFK